MDDTSRDTSGLRSRKAYCMSIGLEASPQAPAITFRVHLCIFTSARNCLSLGRMGLRQLDFVRREASRTPGWRSLQLRKPAWGGAARPIAVRSAAGESRTASHPGSGDGGHGRAWPHLPPGQQRLLPLEPAAGAQRALHCKACGRTLRPSAVTAGSGFHLLERRTWMEGQSISKNIIVFIMLKLLRYLLINICVPCFNPL